MKTAWKRTGAVLVSWLLLCLLALSASAVGPVEVGVAFWKDSKGEQTSLANDGIDTDRAATLTRQANGTAYSTMMLLPVISAGTGRPI